MMHESNTPQVMKAASDVELFRAVHKLKGFLRSGAISAQTFVQNRRMLLKANERTSRAISSLTRNDELANAIEQALAHEYIAKEFSAGSWMRLTTGRLYMVRILTKALYLNLLNIKTGGLRSCWRDGCSSGPLDQGHD